MSHRRTITQLRSTAAAIAVSAALFGAAPRVLAHGPDPLLGGSLWSPNQAVVYQWRSGEVPPDWMRTAIDAAAADSNASRAAKAAILSRASSAPSVIGYADPFACASDALACMTRANAPTSFAVFFTADGHVFDWGSLRWCQGPSGFVTGCFDVENIALDELGHVEDLGHHVNYLDGSDFGDALVQKVSVARATSGWNRHSYGRCDVARLQLEYERLSTSGLFSTCLSLATTTSLSPSSTSISYGGSVTFTAGLAVAKSSTYLALSGDAIAGRTVVLQRRVPGSTSWTTAVTMSPSGNVYVATLNLFTTYDWRARFATPSGEGLVGSTSGVVTVKVGPCTFQCPLAVVR